MRVARLDRPKFNQAVADDYYRCAPPTVAGSVRLFQEDDLVTLYVFARLLELGVLPRRAGQLACEFKSALRDRNDKPHDRVIYVRGTTDDFWTDADHYDPDHEKKGKGYRGVGPIVMSVEFNVGTIRRLIDEAIEFERSIVGIEGADD